MSGGGGDLQSLQEKGKNLGSTNLKHEVMAKLWKYELAVTFRRIVSKTLSAAPACAASTVDTLVSLLIVTYHRVVSQTLSAAPACAATASPQLQAFLPEVFLQSPLFLLSQHI